MAALANSYIPMPSLLSLTSPCWWMFGDSIITPHPPKYLSPLPPSLQTHYHHCLNSGSRYPPRIFQALPPPISLGCVENHLPETAIYQANAVSSPPTVPYSLKSDLLEKSIQGLPATSCFSHNLPCSLSSLTLDPPRTSLTHNADPCNCLYTFTWLKGNSLPCPNSIPGKHLCHPSSLSLRITSQWHLLWPSSPPRLITTSSLLPLKLIQYFTLHRDHTLVGVTNTNTHRTNQVS